MRLRLVVTMRATAPCTSSWHVGLRLAGHVQRQRLERSAWLADTQPSVRMPATTRRATAWTCCARSAPRHWGRRSWLPAAAPAGGREAAFVDGELARAIAVQRERQLVGHHALVIPGGAGFFLVFGDWPPARRAAG
jgi:hypothetical protein